MADAPRLPVLRTPDGIIKTLDQWREFAHRDDCLKRMVPSDLRLILRALGDATGDTSLPESPEYANQRDAEIATAAGNDVIAVLRAAFVPRAANAGTMADALARAVDVCNYVCSTLSFTVEGLRNVPAATPIPTIPTPGRKTP